MDNTITPESFLLQCIDEDEAVARDAINDDMGSDEGFTNRYEYLTDDRFPRIAEDAARMITRFAVPRRILAECKAKRAIVEHLRMAVFNYVTPIAIQQHLLCALALPYADRPGYDEAWR